MLGKTLPVLGALAIAFLLVPTAGATHNTSNDNSNSATWLVSTYGIAFGDDLTTLTIDATIGVNKLTDGGTTIRAADMRAGYQAAGTPTAKAAYVKPYRDQIWGLTNSTLSTMFPGRPQEYLQVPAPVESTFTGGTGPVQFTLRVRISLSASSEGLGSYDGTKIEAAFRAGAAVSISRTFSAQAGHDNTFTLTPPSYAKFTAASGDAPIDANGRVTVRLDNADGTSTLTPAATSLTLRDPAQTPPTAEDVLIRTSIMLREFERENNVCCKAGLPVDVTVSTQVGALDVTKRMPSLATPSAVTLPGFLSSDALRLLSQRGIVTASDISAAENSINAQIKKDVDASFKATTSVVTVSSFDLTGTVPQVLGTTRASFTSKIANTIYYDIGAPSNTADAALAAGATVFFNITLEEQPGVQQVYNISLPDDLAYVDGAPPADCGGSAKNVRPAWRNCPVPDDTKKRAVAMTLGDPTVVRPTAEVINNAVAITIPSMRGVNTTTLPLNVGVTASVVSLDVKARFPGVLPSNVRLDYLSASGFRTLYQRGVITEAELVRSEGDLVRDANATLQKAFPHGVTTTGGFARSSLASGTAANQPVVFAATAVARQDIGAKPDRADAAFDAGAIVSTTFDLTSTTKQLTNYTIRLPAGLTFFDGATPAGHTKNFTVDARTSATDVKTSAPLRFGRDMVRAKTADLTVAINVQIGKLSEGANGMPVSVDVTALLTGVKVGERFPGALPSNVDLPILSADGLRVLHARGVLTERDLGNATENMTKDIRSRLVAAFGDRVNVTASMQKSSLTGTGPIVITARAAVVKDLGVNDPNLAGKVGKVADIILEAGAIVGQKMTLGGIADANVTYTVTLPENLAFRNVTGADSVSNRTLSLTLVGAGSTQDPSKELVFKLVNPGARRFTQQTASINIDLDLQLDVDLVTAVQTQDATMVMGVSALVSLSVLEVPADLKGQLPADVDIQFIPVDVLRRLRAEGILSDEQLDKITSEFKSQVEGGLEGVAGGKVNAVVTLDRAQLATSLMTSPISGDNPVKITATATIRKSLAGKPAASGFTLAEIPLGGLPLQSFQGLPTTYKVVLPIGLEVSKAVTSDPQNSEVETGKTPEGRSYFIAKVYNGKTANVETAVAVTHDLLVDKFLPWIILAGFIVVGLVALPIWGIVRLVRRNKGGAE